MAEQNFWVNALIGAVATVVLTFTLLSPLIGGGVAGYLQRGDEHDGAKVGAASGLLAAIPVFFLVVFIFGFLTVGTMMAGEPGGSILFGTLSFVIVVFVVIYTVGLSLLGGLVGAALAERETAD